MNFLHSYKSDIQKLCTDLHISQLYSFGSVNTDRFGPESDLDFMVDLSEKNETDYAEAYFSPADGLEKIAGRAVDLVIKRSLQNSYFIQKVEESKTLLYAN